MHSPEGTEEHYFFIRLRKCPPEFCGVLDLHAQDEIGPLNQFFSDWLSPVSVEVKSNLLGDLDGVLVGRRTIQTQDRGGCDLYRPSPLLGVGPGNHLSQR